MPDRSIERVALVGAGNVGSHLGQALFNAGCEVGFVWSRTETSARALANDLASPWSTGLTDIPLDLDLYILSVPDDQIRPMAEELGQILPASAFVVHTSGATADDQLSHASNRYGSFYPLQSFTKEKAVDFQSVPLCLSATIESDLQLLEVLAGRISKNVHRVDPQQRLTLHLGAVFVNNFTNYLQYISTSLLEEAELDTRLLQPLLQETVQKLEKLSPAAAQTGPARRGDLATIQRHLELLKGHPEWQEVYRLLTSNIRKDLGKR